jgi:hypothetical protein
VASREEQEYTQYAEKGTNHSLLRQNGLNPNHLFYQTSTCFARMARPCMTWQARLKRLWAKIYKTLIEFAVSVENSLESPHLVRHHL